MIKFDFVQDPTFSSSFLRDTNCLISSMIIAQRNWLEMRIREGNSLYLNMK